MTEVRIPLSSPDINEQDIQAVVEVLRSSRLSLGPMLLEFEREFAEYLETPHAIAVSSGTGGLHLALLALGIGVGDEVIVPSFTFIAAANAIRYVGGTPVFVDIESSTLNMDPSCVEHAITPKTRALMVVHTFGVPAEMTRLLSIADAHGLKVIEDACEAIGAEYATRKVGTFGDAAVFAFYPNKQITTGEGGMVVTRDQHLADTIRSLRNQGRRAGDGWYEHSDLGYNYRLSELSCALGRSQLRRIEAILLQRARVAEHYHRLLCNDSALVLPPMSLPERRLSWFVYVVRLNVNFTSAQRDRLQRYLLDRGIGCGRYFAPIHQQPSYAALHSANLQLPISESEAARTIALPFFNRLAPAQIEEVCELLTKAIPKI